LQLAGLEPLERAAPLRRLSAGSVCGISGLQRELDSIASETEFSGVVRIDRADGIEVAKAYGLAHRGFAIPTRSTLASRSRAGRRA
jgi:hypothetical protein